MKKITKIWMLSTSVLVLILMLLGWLLFKWYVNYAPIQPFLIYYGGIPTTHRQIENFVNRIDGYPIVILGDGLSDPAHATAIIKLAKKNSLSTTFWGYISIGVTHQSGNLNSNEVKLYLLRWKKIGASGVLFDTAGPDFGVTHKRLFHLVALAHHYGMRVIVNSWYPQAVLNVG